MKNASDLADAIGRKTIAEALGVGGTAVSNAVVRGSFPPSWYLVIKDLAEGAKCETLCREDLFHFKGTDKTVPPTDTS